MFRALCRESGSTKRVVLWQGSISHPLSVIDRTVPAESEALCARRRAGAAATSKK